MEKEMLQVFQDSEGRFNSLNLERFHRQFVSRLPARSGYTFLASNPLFQRENPLVLPFRGMGSFSHILAFIFHCDYYVSNRHY